MTIMRFGDDCPRNWRAGDHTVATPVRALDRRRRRLSAPPAPPWAGAAMSTRKGGFPIPRYWTHDPLDCGAKWCHGRSKLGVCRTAPVCCSVLGLWTASRPRYRTPVPRPTFHRPSAPRGARTFKPRSTSSDDRDVILIQRRMAIPGACPASATTSPSSTGACEGVRIDPLPEYRASGRAAR